MGTVMTAEALGQMVARGYGQGRDESYQSWIRVRRRTSAKVSNLYAFATPLYRRHLNLLSGLEFEAAQILLWLLGTGEIREQFPAWPGEHVHPLFRPSLFSVQPQRVQGLMSIASEAGIKHGFYPGTKLPFVATMDFAVTVRTSELCEKLVLVSCKPKKVLETARNRERMKERIALETLYAKEIGSLHVLFDGEGYTKTLVANLDWFRPYLYQMESRDIRSRIVDYAGNFMRHAETPIVDAKSKAAYATKCDSGLSEDVFKTAAWLGLIPIDFTQTIVMSNPLQQDYGAKDSLRKKFLGVDTCSH